ncbi:MAG: ABC transporter permease subunit [Alphaproteobacteria bacterium]|nr:ABC transporter permease subunit [Alphaproteobacteria bacterium]
MDVTLDAVGPRRARRRDPWQLLPLLIAALVALPVIVVCSRVLFDASGVWGHLAATVLDDYIVNSLGLVLGVGLSTALLGVGAAWLVARYDFPLRGVMEWALLLPLAAPAYIVGYVYTDLLDAFGPVQAGLRTLFGWDYGDYWFPRIRSIEGAVFVMSFVFYPYVYLLSRAAFIQQCSCLVEVSRTLGAGPWRTFRTVALPAVRPAMAAGLALVVMETLADYGTVAYFGVPTFTTGIYRAWFGMGEPAAAAQLSAVLLAFVLTVVVLERLARRAAKYHHTTKRYRAPARVRLRGRRAALALALCALPVAVGFLIPTAVLVVLSFGSLDPITSRVLPTLAWNSATLAAVTAVLGVGLGLALAYQERLRPTRPVRGAVRIAAMGYAVPGSVIAVGILLPLAAFDNAVNRLAEDMLGVSTGLILTGSIAALVFGYLVRFLAVSYNAVEAGLQQVPSSMDDVARALGQSPGGLVRRVHAPMIRGSLLTAGLLVFVDVLKELPATLILRPFNFDTLAVWVYRLAQDERLAEASTAALAIVLVGLLPIIVLSRAISRAREWDRGDKRRLRGLDKAAGAVGRQASLGAGA